MVNKSKALSMSPEHRAQLESWIRAKTTPQRVVFRSQICLLAAEGMSTTRVAQSLNTSRPTVLLWKKRFEEQGPPGLLQDAPRGPSRRRIDESIRDTIVDAAMNQAPPDGMKRWTTRALAKVLGVSNATVARVWRSRGIKSPQRKVEKPSKAKTSGKTRLQVIGVYLAPSVYVFAARPKETMPPGRELPDDVTSQFQCEYTNAGYADVEHGCSHCFAAAIELINTITSSELGTETDFIGLLQFLQSLEPRASAESAMVLVLFDPFKKVTEMVEDWVGVTSFISIRISKGDPLAFTPEKSGPRSESENISLCMTPAAVSSLVRRLGEYVHAGMGLREPFGWIDEYSVSHDVEHCKVVSETMRRLGGFMAAVLKINTEVLSLFYSTGGHPMNWKLKMESFFAAAAFAEEGEHSIAAEIAACPIPQSDVSLGVLSTFTKSFAASAFAEENCHDMAAEILSDRVTRKPFLDAVGLSGLRVRYGIAYLEQSFVDAVGLSGAKCKLLTLRL